MEKGNLNGKISRRLDDYFTARQLPAIAWGGFFPFLISCVRADGGTFDPLHRLFEFPPTITGGQWETLAADEIFNHWWNAERQTN